MERNPAPNVNLIAAVGPKGELGFKGGLPWEDKEDLAWFRKMTMGDVVIMGSATYWNVAEHLDGRYCIRFSREGMFKGDIPSLIKNFEQQTIWVAGGARTYEAWIPYVRRSFITHIGYSGPSDTRMPGLWTS